MKKKTYIFSFFFQLLLIHSTVNSFCQVKDTTVIFRDTLNLQEIVISPPNMGALPFRTTVLQTQRIGRSELSRAACCNLAESFETNPSVDVSYNDAVTGARQIRLLGLDGVYVQLLSENFPAFNGLARVYGLDYIPGPWMESILISKGTSSVKNGYEAITGQINVEYKKPLNSDILTANLFVADNARLELNMDANVLINEQLSSGIFLHYSSEQKEMDKNKDGFIDIPLKQQVNFLNRWYYKTDDFISQFGIQYVHDSREGGQKENILTSNSIYKTDLNIDRVSFFAKNGLILNHETNESIALIISGAYHDQNAGFGRRIYDADEKSLYGSLLYEKNLTSENKLSAGASINHQYIKESFSEEIFPSKLKETTTGAYLEYTYNNYNNFILLTGLRVDYSNIFNLFLTPRLHIKYNFTDWMHLRGTIGKGYRTPLILAENHHFLASSRQFYNLTKDNYQQEEAWNYGLNLGIYIPVNEKELVINGEWYYTNFEKQVIVDADTDPRFIFFYNLKGNSYSSIFQIEVSYPFFRGFHLTGAIRWMDVKSTYNGKLKKKPLTSDYKALITASYQTALKKWQFDLTSQFNGGGRMPAPASNQPLWKENFPSYTIVNAQITKNFRDWSIYGGVENIFDYVQEDRIIGKDDPFGPDFDATMIWGPVHGRKFYIGLRYNIQRL